jgi:putative acetyltransferase
MKDLVVRSFRDEDTQATAQIFFDAVHIGSKEYYNLAQRNAWAAKAPDVNEWRKRLRGQNAFVAEVNSKPAGFMTIAANGNIDLAFVAPAFAGKGVAKALYDVVETEALQLGVTQLHTEASFQARKFLERQGWQLIMEQFVFRDGVSLTNFVMEKKLS